jgi:UDP-N-acetylglucosamine 2-epimerase (non-hydrolysing)
MVGLEKAILEEDPEAVVVEGDTNTVLGAALASVKLHVPICHVEAGLRSYDLQMPEEHNRRLVDHMSSILFAPTPHAATTLRRERVWGQIFVTGNTVIDACIRFSEKAIARSRILSRIRFEKFVLATFHRAENVDNISRLRTIVRVLTRCPVPVVFPVHPRTLICLKSAQLVETLEASENVQLLPPMGYFDFLASIAKSEFIITDSGGIQEEATAPNIRKFVFVLRRRTDRPESVEAGFARVVGIEDADHILRAIHSFVENRVRLARKSPYGDGKAGLRIARVLKSGAFEQ